MSSSSENENENENAMVSTRSEGTLMRAGLHTLPELLLIIQCIQDLELHGENVDVSWQYHDHIKAVCLNMWK